MIKINNTKLIQLRYLICNDYIMCYMLAKNEFVKNFYRKQEIELAKRMMKLKYA